MKTIRQLHNEEQTEAALQETGREMGEELRAYRRDLAVFSLIALGWVFALVGLVAVLYLVLRR